MNNLKIIHRLIIGYVVVILLHAVAVSTTLIQTNIIRGNTDRIVNLRTPTAQASSNMASHIYASLAALRGWMLTKNDEFKVERKVIWVEISKLVTLMNGLSNNWTNPENIVKWNEFKVTLAEFLLTQEKIEAVSHTLGELPAATILLKEAAPRAAVMAQKITEMIDLELSGDGSKVGGDVKLLALMADIRGSLGLSLASIRAYLLFNKKTFSDDFHTQWAKNQASFDNLLNFESSLSPEQKEAFDVFKTKRAEFTPLPTIMLSIRASKKWNMANFLLVTEAVPRSKILLTIMLGELQEDGSRSGGMVQNQRNLLEIDESKSITSTQQLFTLQWVLLFFGITIGGGIAYLTARSIALPVVDMTNAMTRLADEDFDVEIPALRRRDEIGDMADAVQIFKVNAIERDRLKNEREELFKELDFQKFALDEHAIVSIADVQGNITYANKKFCEISEYLPEELESRNHRILKSDEHTADFFADMWKTISRGKVWQGEIKNKKKGGGYYWVMSTIVPTLNENGKPFQYVSIRTDITERKEVEIEAMTANRAKSELMANMSHELRTPLNAIIGFSGMIQDETFGPIGNDKYQDYLDDIHNSGKHLLAIINDILDVSAIEAGSLALNEENVSIPDIVEASIRIIRPRADTGQVTITSTIDPESPHIYADGRRIKQILLNLLSNAVKFTPEKGEVSVSSHLNDNGSIAIAISDTGIGMDEDETIKAMSAFGQVDSGLGRKHEGSGLGLPLSKGLVEIHDGTMEIKSEKGRGTLITVTFPKERVVTRVTS